MGAKNEVNMNDKFKNVPTDPETRVLKRSLAVVGGYDVLHERWSWDGIKAESFVFLSSEVADMSDQVLERIVRDTVGVDEGSQITLKRSDSGFTFVNFNFGS
jgi:hypothetical protein